MSTKKFMLMAKDTVKLGAFSMAGMGAMGALKGMAPNESAGAFNATSSGMQMVNVGNMASIGMNLSSMMPPKKGKKGKY